MPMHNHHVRTHGPNIQGAIDEKFLARFFDRVFFFIFLW